MPERAKLKEALDAIHQELESGAPVDPALAESLRGVMEDIQRVLEGAGAPEPETLRDRITEATVDLEQSHPTLVDTLNRISQTLAGMGI